MFAQPLFGHGASWVIFWRASVLIASIVIFVVVVVAVISIIISSIVFITVFILCHLRLLYA